MKVEQILAEATSNIASRSHCDVAHLNSATNILAKYQLPTPNSFKILPGQDFEGQDQCSKVKGQING